MSANNWAEPDGRRASQGSSLGLRSDAENHLSRMFGESVGDRIEQMLYRPSNTASGAGGGASTQNKAPSAMGNGKDFFAELRKQVASLTEKEKAGG